MYKPTAAILCVRCEWRIRDSPARTESAACVSADALCGANGGSVRAKCAQGRTHTRARDRRESRSHAREDSDILCLLPNIRGSWPWRPGWAALSFLLYVYNVPLAPKIRGLDSDPGAIIGARHTPRGSRTRAGGNVALYISARA